MTKKREAASKKGRSSPWLLASLYLALLILLMINAESSAEHMRRGLSLCFDTLIPSLFPFMVISDILTRAGFAELAGRLFDRPMRALFGIGGDGAGAVLLGMLCGFPIGARSTVALYDSGRLSRSECELLLTFSNNPSAAFTVSAVGVSLFGSKALGLELYAVSLLASLAVGFFFCRGQRKREKVLKHVATTPKTERLSVISELTEAISASAIGVIKVASFVLFFSVLLGLIGDTVDRLPLGVGAKAMIFGVFELTSGVAEAASLDDPRTALTVAAFALGWSGLSVHFQIMSICGGRGLSFARYFLAKLAEGVICAAYMAIRVNCFMPSLEKNAGAEPVLSMPSSLSHAMLLLFIISIPICAIVKKKTFISQSS